jgi:hypothetical protein
MGLWEGKREEEEILSRDLPRVIHHEVYNVYEEKPPYKEKNQS